MGNTEDPRKSARVGQPGEKDRTSQQNAGSTEGGGTRNADKAGTGREQGANSRTSQGGDDLEGNDIERAGTETRPR
jgi:hypothetical protein